MKNYIPFSILTGDIAAQVQNRNQYSDNQRTLERNTFRKKKENPQAIAIKHTHVPSGVHMKYVASSLIWQFLLFNEELEPVDFIIKKCPKIRSESPTATVCLSLSVAEMTAMPIIHGHKHKRKH